MAHEPRDQSARGRPVRGSGRWLSALVAAATLLVAVGIAGCGSSGVTDPSASPAAAGDPRSSESGTSTASTTPSDPRSPALRHLQWVLESQLHSAGPKVGALVVDLDTGATLFTLNANVGRPPASVEKLYTTVASDVLLGPHATFPTEILGAGHLGPHGIWHGDLYLRGDGDPTFGDGTFNNLYENGQGPTASELVEQLQQKGIRRVTGKVIGDESRFDTLRGDELTGYGPDIPDYGGELSALVYDGGAVAKGLGPAAFAARELVLTMRASHIRATADHGTGVTPTDARLLALVHSPPLSVMLRLMDVPSNDLIADLLTKQLGYSMSDQGSLAAGSREIAAVIATHYGLHPTILDGSGLDLDDRSSPAQVVTLLRRAVRNPRRLVAHSVTADHRCRRHRPGDRRSHTRTGTLHRQDRNAGRRHQPRRILHRARFSSARVRAVHRRARRIGRRSR